MENAIMITFGISALIFYCLGNWVGRFEQTIIDSYKKDIEKIENEFRFNNTDKED